MAATRRETIVAVVVFVGAVIALGVSVVTTGTYVLAAVLGIVTVVVVLCSYAVLMLVTAKRSVEVREPIAATRSQTVVAVVAFVGALIALGAAVASTRNYALAGALAIVVVGVTVCSYLALVAVATVWSGRWGARPWSPFRLEAERIVIGQIATVMRQNLPTASALAIAADSETGVARVALRRISRLLAQGVPLTEAVRHGFPQCSTLVQSLIIAGEQAGQLPAALEQAEAYLVERNRRRMEGPVAIWPYGLCLLFAMFVFLSGIMVFVVPRFREIFRDYHAELPPSTRALVAVSNWFVGLEEVAPNSFQEVFPGWVIIFVLVPVLFGFLLWLRRRRVPEPTIASEIADSIRWVVPGWRKMERAQGMAAALRTLGLGVRAGLDVAQSARVAAGIDVNARLRARLTHFAELAAAGKNLRAAATETGLGEVVGIALAAGQRGGRLEESLQYAAGYYDAIFSRGWTVLKNLLWPVGTLILATLVGSVVYGFFSPLVALLDAVCDSWGT